MEHEHEISFQIMIICRHPQILDTLLRIVNTNKGWCADGFVTDDEAMIAFKAKKFDMVLLGSGIQNTAEESLRQYFSKINPAIAVVQHYGGGSGLLNSEIQSVLSNYNK